MPDVEFECPVCGGEMKDVRANTKQCVVCGAVRGFEPEVAPETDEVVEEGEEKTLFVHDVAEDGHVAVSKISVPAPAKDVDAEPEEPPLTTATTVLESVSHRGGTDPDAKLNDVAAVAVGHTSVTVATKDPSDDATEEPAADEDDAE